MILPIVAIGDQVLKTKAKNLASDLSAAELQSLIADMYETMYAAHGVGLAAPQIGKALRLFVIDTAPMVELDEEDIAAGVVPEAPLKQAFLNPQMVSETGPEWGFEEGCLSIPGIREMVQRCPDIVLRYEDENRQTYEVGFSGMTARVIQHEYDHLEGILFTDKLSAFKKQLLKGKLARITKGDVKHDYRMKFPPAGRR